MIDNQNNLSNKVDGLLLQANSYMQKNQLQNALNTLQEAICLQPNNLNVLVNIAICYYNKKNYDQALKFVLQSEGIMPKHPIILWLKAEVLKYLGRARESVILLEQIIAAHNDIEAMIGLATIYWQFLRDIEKAKKYYDLAYQKDPNHYTLLQKLAFFLLTARVENETEGGNIDRAHQMISTLVNNNYSLNLAELGQLLFLKTLDYDGYNKLGSFKDMVNYWAESVHAVPMLLQMSRVENMQDRIDLLNAHKNWGDAIESVAKNNPIMRKVRSRLNSKIRLGILSSDLRNHPVGNFAWPLIEYLPRNEFEIFCYNAYPHGSDPSQQDVMQKVDSFKTYREEANCTIAQSIYDDHIDVLLELGGTTLFNKIEICAYKPAPIQISWLGYPHSTGLSSIDYILLDPYIHPENSSLLLEKPLAMPHTWVSMDEKKFGQKPLAKSTPEDQNGYITFGTMNAPYKLTPETFATWASIMRDLPNSKFLYVRPETESGVLRSNFHKYMNQHGVNSDRVSFVATHHNHLEYYNNIDISLDTFPHTGGTTTCEALWMGVPVVTLVGESFYERISYSNLKNSSLENLCAFNLKQYKNIALDIASNKDLRQYLRTALRRQIIENPLGQTRQFAADFAKLLKIY